MPANKSSYPFLRTKKHLVFTPKAVGPHMDIKRLARRNPKKKTA